MSRFKRVLGLGFVAGVLAAVALAVPASAATVKGACVVQGSVKMQDKTAWPPIGVRLVGGHGIYTFASLGIICAGLEKGAPAVGSITGSSVGTYANIICGTGNAVSGAGGSKMTAFSYLVGGGPGYKGAAAYNTFVSGLQYEVDFYAFTGVMSVNNVAGLKDLPVGPVNLFNANKPGQPFNGDLDAAGVIVIVPDPIAKPGTPNIAAGECTKAFQLVGAFKAEM